VPVLGRLLFGYLGYIAAFITTVKAALCLKFSLNEAVESDDLRWG